MQPYWTLPRESVMRQFVRRVVISCQNLPFNRFGVCVCEIIPLRQHPTTDCCQRVAPATKGETFLGKSDSTRGKSYDCLLQVMYLFCESETWHWEHYSMAENGIRSVLYSEHTQFEGNVTQHHITNNTQFTDAGAKAFHKIREATALWE